MNDLIETKSPKKPIMQVFKKSLLFQLIAYVAAILLFQALHHLAKKGDAAILVAFTSFPIIFIANFIYVLVKLIKAQVLGMKLFAVIIFLGLLVPLIVFSVFSAGCMSTFTLYNR